MDTKVNTPAEIDLKGQEKDLKREPLFLISVGVLLLLFCGSYWRSLFRLVDQWYSSPDYIYGFFVLPFSIYLLWDRRKMLDGAEVRFCLWGIPLILLGIAFRCYAGYSFRPAVEASTLWITFAGLVLLVGGWQIMRWAWPGVVFLVFMVPLPGYLNAEFRSQLQQVCTAGSVFLLQTFGVSAIREGSVISLPNAPPLGVVDACSGLRTLMLFFAACTGAAFYVKRHYLMKIIMILSAIPIAIFCNTIRITITALVHMHSVEMGEITHDLAGLVMMPMAICLLWVEMTLIEKLFILDSEDYQPLLSEPVGASKLPDRSNES